MRAEAAGVLSDLSLIDKTGAVVTLKGLKDIDNRRGHACAAAGGVGEQLKGTKKIKLRESGGGCLRKNVEAVPGAPFIKFWLRILRGDS